MSNATEINIENVKTALQRTIGQEPSPLPPNANTTASYDGITDEELISAMAHLPGRVTSQPRMGRRASPELAGQQSLRPIPR